MRSKGVMMWRLEVEVVDRSWWVVGKDTFMKIWE